MCISTCECIIWTKGKCIRDDRWHGVIGGVGVETARDFEARGKGKELVNRKKESIGKHMNVNWLVLSFS